LVLILLAQRAKVLINSILQVDTHCHLSAHILLRSLIEVDIDMVYFESEETSVERFLEQQYLDKFLLILNRGYGKRLCKPSVVLN